MPALRSLTSSVLLIACVAPLSAQGVPNAAPDWAAFDRYVAQAARDWHVPALAIAVVKNDSLVFAKGYGTLQAGGTTRADEHTRFAIGSTTKAMTSAGLAMLVDEGKLRFDDPVTKYIPELQMYDPYVTRELTIRDLLTHRTGLGSVDLFWYEWRYPRAEVIRRLRFVKPAWSFRAQWDYNNVMYSLAGTVIERVTGMPWETFVRQRIFTPLGMTETVPLVSEIIGKPNVAVPHFELGDSVRVIPVRSTDGVASAGSVWSSVSDMSKWMRFVLDSGRVGTTRLIKPATFAELTTPQIQAPMSEYPALRLAQPTFFSYGLGWFIQDYHEHPVWMHTGSIDGMCAIIGLLPKERVGVYVLENLDHAELRHALMYRVFDLYTSGTGRDWSSDLHALFARNGGAAAATVAQQSAAQPSLPLEQYAGSYTDSTYGTVSVTLVDGALHAQVVSDPERELTHTSFESFRTSGTDLTNTTVLTFLPDGAGGVTAVRVDGVTFARIRPRR